MAQTRTADVFTLRPRSENLLPRLTLLLYAPDKSGLLQTLTGVAQAAEPDWEIVVMLDGPNLQDEDLAGLMWPDDVPIHVMETDYPYGKSYCVNLALSFIESDFLFVADAGDQLHIDCIKQMATRLETADARTVGICAGFVWDIKTADNRVQSRLFPAASSRKVSQFFSRLAMQKQLAPPLVRTSAVQKIGGYPTDYPSEGFLLADTAFLLALLQTGHLDAHEDSCLHRTAAAKDAYQTKDERKLLQVLLRQAAKQLQLPLQWARLT